MLVGDLAGDGACCGIITVGITLATGAVVIGAVTGVITTIIITTTTCTTLAMAGVVVIGEVATDGTV